MMTDGESNLSSTDVRGGYRFEEAVPVRDGQQLEIAGFQFRVIHTPGHTPGGCCYYMEQEGVLFSGDTLFQTSVGRSDFPGGSASELVRSVRRSCWYCRKRHMYIRGIWMKRRSVMKNSIIHLYNVMLGKDSDKKQNGELE